MLVKIVPPSVSRSGVAVFKFPGWLLYAVLVKILPPYVSIRDGNFFRLPGWLLYAVLVKTVPPSVSLIRVVSVLGCQDGCSMLC